MDNERFEKRMELLKKSYERVPSTFDPSKVLQKLEAETKPADMPAGKRKKINQQVMVWVVGIASILIISLIAGLYVADQKNTDEEPVTSEELDQFITKLQKDYEKEREKRRALLKLEKEDFEKYDANNLFWFLKDDSYMANLRADGNPEGRLMQDYKEGVENLKTPSEMVADLKSNPLTEDKEGSLEFIYAYREKVERLTAIYNEILQENNDLLQAYEVDPSLDKAYMIGMSKGAFPERLQNILNTMKEQSIQLQSDVDSYGEEFFTKYYSSKIHEQIVPLLNPDTRAYIDMMTEAPYIVAGELVYPLEESVEMMRGMQHSLTNVDDNSALYQLLETYYVTMFNTILRGTEKSPVFDEQGKVKQEYREAWKNMASGSEATPLRYVMMPIVEEMEESGWTTSETLNRIGYDALKDALVVQRAGQLEMYMYGEQPVFPDEEIKLPDAAFDKKIEDLYGSFKKQYDLSVLAGRTPVEIVALYMMANEKEDPEMMYHLHHENVWKYSETGYEITLEHYKESWQKGLSLLQFSDEISFSGESVHRIEPLLYGTVDLSRQGNSRYALNVLYDNGIWQIGDLTLTKLPSYDEYPLTEITDDTMKNIVRLYNQVSEDQNGEALLGIEPMSIVALYYYAGFRNDLDTLYKLYYKGPGSDLVGKEEFMKTMKPSWPRFNELFTSMSFKGMEQDKEGNWPGVATLHVNTEQFPDYEKTVELPMIWTEDGWRVKYEPK